ncbi:fatty acid desaturase [Nostoc flagelliforme]|nr:fatty acid desaturase [Nostoc flagelliforme]
MSCYHFGYHQEHHEYPDVPWWKLPAYKHKVWQSNGTKKRENR